MIIVRSPTRVDLAGGTLDLWPLYLFVDGATTVNVAISLFTEVQLEPLPLSTQIIFDCEDLNLNSHFSSREELLESQNPQLLMIQTLVSFFRPQEGFRLRTHSESPIGAGLGGSSSLVISLIKAFAQFCSYPIKDVYHLVELAHNLEAKMIGAMTGTRDYFPAILGGMNFIDYQPDQVQVKTPSVDLSAFNERSLLIYTGKAHHSGLNNFEVVKDCLAKNENTFQSLRDLKRISEKVASVCLKGDWLSLGSLFNAEYEARTRLAPAFSSPEIKFLKDLSLKNGAEAVKICGAGGGGCVLVWGSPESFKVVKKECQNNGFQVLEAKALSAI